MPWWRCQTWLTQPGAEACIHHSSKGHSCTHTHSHLLHELFRRYNAHVRQRDMENYECSTYSTKLRAFTTRNIFVQMSFKYTDLHSFSSSHLTLRNVSCKIGNRVRNIVVGHSKNRNLRNRTISALHTPGPLIDGRKIRVHITGVTTPARNLLTGGGHLTESVGV